MLTLMSLSNPKNPVGFSSYEVEGFLNALRRLPGIHNARLYESINLGDNPAYRYVVMIEVETPEQALSLVQSEEFRKVEREWRDRVDSTNFALQRIG